MNVEPLIWDTDFFKFSIAAIRKPKADIINDLNNLDTDYKLIYIFSETRIKLTKPIQGVLKWVDTKVVFRKELKDQQIANVMHYNSSVHRKDQLLSLVHLSGKYSRFKTDSLFPPGSFELLYQKWLDRSFENENSAVLVTLCENQLSGFVTVDIISSNEAKIGLIAVAEKFQGKGIGSQLIRLAEIYSLKKGAKYLEVATQRQNEPAMNLYEKNLFKLKEKTYIYHYWKT